MWTLFRHLRAALQRRKLDSELREELSQHLVTQRTPEIGIWMALGVERSTVARMVLRQCAVLAVTGLFIGVTGALLGAKLLESILYELPARDPLTLALSAGVMLAMSMAAGYLPARRASRVDPLTALRND